jgi:hypothetical protein
MQYEANAEYSRVPFTEKDLTTFEKLSNLVQSNHCVFSHHPLRKVSKNYFVTAKKSPTQ